MGCFDTIWMTCPHCHRRTSEQSKGGCCSLANYDVEDCPLDVLGGLDLHPTCERCGNGFTVFVQTLVTTTKDPCEPWGEELEEGW